MKNIFSCADVNFSITEKYFSFTGRAPAGRLMPDEVDAFLENNIIFKMLSRSDGAAGSKFKAFILCGIFFARYPGKCGVVGGNLSTRR